MSIILVNKIIMCAFYDTIRRNENLFCAKRYRCFDLLKCKYTCLENGNDLTLLKELILFGPDFNFIFQSQLREFVQSVYFIGIGAEVLNFFLKNLFDTESIGLILCIRSNWFLIFFEVHLIRFVTVVIMFLQNKVFDILLSVKSLFLTKYDSILNSGYLFVIFKLLESLNWALWCLISHYFNGN